MERKEKSLESVISAGQSLTEAEQATLVSLLGKRCQANTVGKLAFALACVPNIPSYGIYRRVMLESTAQGPVASYCAGQSYPDEIRTVRKLLTKGSR